MAANDVLAWVVPSVVALAGLGVPVWMQSRKDRRDRRQQDELRRQREAILQDRRDREFEDMRRQLDELRREREDEHDDES